MPDYKALYLDLMRSSEKAIRLLIETQQRCEEAIVSEAEPLSARDAAEIDRHKKGEADPLIRSPLFLSLRRRDPVKTLRLGVAGKMILRHR